VFALDTSGSVGQLNVQEMVGFLEQLINSLNVNANDTDPTVSRIGLLTYADTATIQFQLNTYRKRTEILQAINVPYSGGTTNAADAIRLASTYLSNIFVLYTSISLSLTLEWETSLKLSLRSEYTN